MKRSLTASALALALTATATPAGASNINSTEEGPTTTIASVIRDEAGIRVIRATTSHSPDDGIRALHTITGHPATVDDRVWALGTNDPLYSQQWALPAHLFDQAWERNPAAHPVIVAVLDTGVDATHPDLAGVVLPGKDFVSDTSTDDDNGHGTHVAGAIAAIGNNGQGIAGAAPGVRIQPVKVLDSSGSGWDSDVAAGITWAVDNGADVINLSLGGTADPLTEQALNYAHQAGVVVVAAAGNSRNFGNQPSYPAAYATPIAVAAANSVTTVASYSNTGDYVDITAAGTSIVSTYPANQYFSLSGTSMAAPYVSAAAALLLSAEANLTPSQVAERLYTHARDIGASGRDNESGHGLLDVQAALCRCQTQAPPTTDPLPDPSAPTPPESDFPNLPDLPGPPVLEPGRPGLLPTPTLPTLPRLPELPSTTPITAPGLDRDLAPSLSVDLTPARPWVTPAQKNTVTVTVRSSGTGQPIPDATVLLTGSRTTSATTDTRGVARVTLAEKRTSRYLVQVIDITGQHSMHVDTYTHWVAPKVTVTRDGRKFVATLHHPNFQTVEIIEMSDQGEKVRRRHVFVTDKLTTSTRMRKNRSYYVTVSPSSGMIAVRSEPVSR